MEYEIRTASRQEVDLAVEWAAREGWNPGLHDADCYYAADPNGFLVGFLGKEPIATLSAIRYGRSFGFIGFYMVKPSYRGKGYGIRIWNAGLRYLEGRNIGLDGVVAQQENYRRSGFKLAYCNIRYEGTIGEKTLRDAGIVDLSSLPFETVDFYDRPFFPEERSGFIKSWIHQSGCTALGILRENRLSGYGVARNCISGCKIGPLFADTPEAAELLFVALCSCADSSGPVYLDVPEVNQAAVSLAERYGMDRVFETARMYRGEIPDIPTHRVFGVTSFEVG